MQSVFYQPEAVVLVSKHLLNGSGSLRWIYRELAPTQSQDTGWLLFADNDNEQWNQEPNNFMPVVVATALAIEPSLQYILDLPYGTDLVFVNRNQIKGWWKPKSQTPIWLSDGTITPHIVIKQGEVMANDDN
ncbi:immunity protein Imm33 domain-containing protein [Leuconostoc citreum]|uniref:immunity protein Imm33 domain-containing protein n=1 Tax=Leuconostoc citreum TaxID=33964 RepID=UPI0032DF9F5F